MILFNAENAKLVDAEINNNDIPQRERYEPVFSDISDDKLISTCDRVEANLEPTTRNRFGSVPLTE